MSQEIEKNKSNPELQEAFKEIYFRDLHKRIFQLNPSSDPHAFAHHVAWISFLAGVNHAKNSQ